MAPTKKVSQFAVRPVDIDHFLDNRFEGPNSVKKAELTDRLINLFFAYDGKAFAGSDEKLRNEKKKLADMTATLKKLTKLHDEVRDLDKNNVYNWATTKGITIPDDIGVDSIKSFVTDIYSKKIASIKAETDRLTLSVKNITDELADTERKCSEFKKNCRKEYSAWKETELNNNLEELKSLKQRKAALPAGSEQLTLIDEEIKRRESTFTYLTSVLNSQTDRLTPLHKENFEIRLVKDALTHGMRRFANAEKHLAFYVNEILTHLFNNCIDVYRSLCSLESGTTLFPLSLSHVDLSKFSVNEVYTLYCGFVPTLVKNASDPTDEERKTRIYAAVESFLKRRIKEESKTPVGLMIKTAGCDQKLVSFAYRLVVEFLTRVSDMIAANVESNKIRTFQDKIIVDIFAFNYRAWGKTPFEIEKKQKKNK